MIRMNRKHFETHGGRVRQRDYSMIKSVSNMWYNPRTEKEKREIDVRGFGCGSNALVTR